MPELTRANRGSEERRRAVRLSLEQLEPGLRIVAEDVLALNTRIDLVAVDAHRRAAAIVIAEPGAEARALTLALAHRDWLRAHLPDWLKLAPELGADPGGAVRSLLIAASFEPETFAAAEALPTGWIELMRIRGLDDAVPCPVGLESIGPRQFDARPVTPAPTAGGRAAGSLPAFRSGLTPEDLGLTTDESSEFD